MQDFGRKHGEIHQLEVLSIYVGIILKLILLGTGWGVDWINLD